MIKFKYNLNENLFRLINQNISDYGYDFLVGYLDEALVGQLRHCNLYLVCECIDLNSQMAYKNPFAIVAKNDVEAAEYFTKETGKTAFIHSILENRCDNLKVERL